MSTSVALEFEKPVKDLEAKIAELSRLVGEESGGAMSAELEKLREQAAKRLTQVYSNLDAWQKCQVARHPDRPQFLALADMLLSDFQPLAGDRNFGDDQAILGGLARFRGRPVVVMGHEKGHDMASRVEHNFGMGRPEGYRKAIRLMEMADQFGLPVLSFVDTPGAYPGKGAEERGQAEAIARSIQAGLRLTVPSISVITGEGGSGGAVALAASNRVLMFEHAVYSVISPEGCASILWRDGKFAKEAAGALNLTAQDLLRLNVIDGIVDEPIGGAHRQPVEAAMALGNALERQLIQLSEMDGASLKRARDQRFLAIGREGLA
ncbi:MAG: acetyl-CoA carboxylase carboxyl transferase subunit alpha [Geminicoccus sp.]|nr:acetyl-CoA carboxylase carboxyl transferase subunit alpha [Geminicoccus sp.]